MHFNDSVIFQHYTKTLPLQKANFAIFWGVFLFSVTGPYFLCDQQEGDCCNTWSVQVLRSPNLF